MSFERTVPTGWDLTNLEEVVDILDSKRVPINAKERETRVGQVPYYGATGQVGWIDDYLFDEELVLLGEDGAPFLDAAKQKAYVVRGKSWVNNHAHVLRARSDIPNAYIKYYLDTVDYHEFVTGTTRLKLNQAAMRRIPVPLAPPNERARIVAEIEKQFSRLDEAVANLKRVKANLKRYKASVLKAAVEGKLTEDWRKQHPDVEPASKLLERIFAQGPDRPSDRTKHKRDVEGDSGALFQLPKNWAWCKAYRLAEIIDPQPSHRTPEEISGGVPYIGMGDVTEQGTIDFLNARKVSRQILEEHRQRYQLRKGNFIFGKIGTLGAPVLLPEPFQYTLSANVVLFQPDSKIANSGFVLAYMRSPIVGSYLARMSKATSQPAFGIQKVREMSVPLPPLEEQNEIVVEVERRLSVIDELEAAVQANRTRADRLRQSILARAFSGELATLQ